MICNVLLRTYDKKCVKSGLSNLQDELLKRLLEKIRW